LSQSSIPEGVAIGAIIRDNTVLKPSADLVIRNKDRIVLLAEKSDLKSVEQLFRVSLDYF
jgi:trk system potassium uptake protein TrkA